MSLLRRMYEHRLTAWIVAFTVAVVWSLEWGYQALEAGRENDAHLRELVEQEQAEEQVEDAKDCIRSWQVREEIRDAVERATQGGASVGARALIAVAGADAETVETYQRFIDEQAASEVADARAEIEDPDCDLGAAQELVAADRG